MRHTYSKMALAEAAPGEGHPSKQANCTSCGTPPIPGGQLWSAYAFRSIPLGSELNIQDVGMVGMALKPRAITSGQIKSQCPTNPTALGLSGTGYHRALATVDIDLHFCLALPAPEHQVFCLCLRSRLLVHGRVAVRTDISSVLDSKFTPFGLFLQ